MSFIRKNYLAFSFFGSLGIGILAFSISYRAAKGDLIEQASRTIEVATDVKWQLLERKLYSLEQQLDLLSQNDKVTRLLSSMVAPKSDTQFDEYIKDLLYNQGCSAMGLLDRRGDAVYSNTTRLNKTSVPEEVNQYAQNGGDSKSGSMIILSEVEPYQFYLCKRRVDSKGTFSGTLYIEVPREFLSVELSNTISLDSLSSYLLFSKGSINQLGKVGADTCVSCRWDKRSYIRFSPSAKIKETWTLLSTYPISQIESGHIMYVATLDGMIAFFVTGIIAMVITYSLFLLEKSKGVTNSDILLVQTTWNSVSEYSIKVIAGFYKHLFTAAPEVKPLFKSEQSVQEKRMALMLNTIVNSADSMEEFKGSIAQLAKRHTHMGVKKEYFPLVVNAIINSVADQYGSGFTSAHKKAWLKILNRISTIMIDEMESYQRTLRNQGS